MGNENSDRDTMCNVHRRLSIGISDCDFLSAYEGERTVRENVTMGSAVFQTTHV